MLFIMVPRGVYLIIYRVRNEAEQVRGWGGIR